MADGQLIVVGGGPVANHLVAGARDGLTVSHLIYSMGLDNLKQTGITLQNGPAVIEKGLGGDASKRERIIDKKDLVVNPDAPVQGRFNVFAAEPGELHSGVKVGDGDVIALAMKTYDTRRALEQITPLLDEQRRSTLLLYQNGFRNETKVSAWLKERGYDNVDVVRAVALGPCTPLGNGVLDNQIFNSMLGHRDIDSSEHMELCQRVAGMFGYIPVSAVPNSIIRKVGGIKASANAFNAEAFLFGCTFHDAIYNVMLKELFQASVHESVGVLRTQGIDVGPREINRITSGMFDSLRVHIASMGNEHFAQIRNNGQSPFVLATEIDDLQGDVVVWGQEYSLPAFWNGAAYDIVTDAAQTYNSLRDGGKVNDALTFIERFISRNRYIVGLEPYQVHRNKGLICYGKTERELELDFRDSDTAGPQALHTCARYMHADKGLVPLLEISYAELKAGYAGVLGDSYNLFRLSQPECTGRCASLRACYQI